MRKKRPLCHLHLWEHETHPVRRTQVLVDQTLIWFASCVGSANNGDTKGDLISIEHIATNSVWDNQMKPCPWKGYWNGIRVERMEVGGPRQPTQISILGFVLRTSVSVCLRGHDFRFCWLSWDEFVFNLKREALRVDGLGRAAYIWSWNDLSCQNTI